ncbi:Homogentisate 1,2-dioxygenase [Hyaloraphidium curvatum]|nr:Homogentisate 1,2-dioxygenase [Hyaloraphidium curvatum]
MARETAFLVSQAQTMTWSPFPIPTAPVDFVDGLRTIAGSGDPVSRTGLAIHVYLCNRSMKDRAFYSADGNMLILPQQGTWWSRPSTG